MRTTCLKAVGLYCDSKASLSSLVRPCLKIKIKKKVDSEAECLVHMWEALGLNPSTKKKKSPHDIGRQHVGRNIVETGRGNWR